MAKIQLASQKMNPTRAGSGLSPSLLSAPRGSISYAGAKIRAPQINQNAGNVNYTGMPVPNIQKDVTANALEQGAGFANTMIDSAFKYQQREDKVIADQAVLDLNSEIRDMFYGTPDENGTLNGGYASTRHQDASKQYGSFQQALDEAIQKKFDGLTSSQRANAVLRMSQTRNGYLTKASQHAATQMGAAQVALADTGFAQGMNQMTTDVLSKQPVDLAALQSVLAQFPDPDERRKRDVQLTETLLGQVDQVNGPQAALKMADDLARTVGVGDAKAIQNFRNFIEQRTTRRKSAVREDYRFNQAVKADELTKVTSAANSDMADNLPGALAAPDSGDMKGLLASVTKAYGDDTASAKDVIEKGMSDAVAEGWENAKAGDSMATTDFARGLREKIPDMPAWVQDDVSRQLDELEAADLADKVKRIADLNKIEDDKIRQSRKSIDSGIDKLAKMDQSGEEAQELAKDLLGRYSSITEGQRTKINRIVQGGDNPYEDRELYKINMNWEKIVDNPELLNDYDISDGVRQKLLEDAKTDRATGATQIRKNAYDELMGYFQLKGNSLTGLNLSTGATGTTETEAKQNFARTKIAYDELVRGYLALDKGKRSMSAASAHRQAMADIIANPSISAGMTGLPKPKAEMGKDSGGQMTYQSDHTNVMRQYSVPEPVKGFKGAPLNLVTYADQIGGRVPLKEGYSPQDMLAERAAEVSDLYQKMIKSTQSIPELAELRNQYTAMTMQYQYLRDLVPSSRSEFSEVQEFSYEHDADTGVTSGGERVRSQMGAAEKDTDLGKQQTDKAKRMYGQAGDKQRVDYQPGTGLFGRKIGPRSIGGTDFDVMAREGGIVPQTYAEQKGQK